MIQDGLVLALDAADTFLPVNRNLLTYTNDLSNAAWGKIRCQITSSATVAPDGTNTAFAINITDATGLVRLSQSPVNASISGGPYTFSVYVKQNASTAQLLDTGLYTSSVTVGSEPSYNILNNFATTGSNGVYVSNRTVTSVGNGWYRIATTATIPNANGWYLFFDIEAGTGTKVNGQGIYLWGPQFEYGTVATDYQPVNATTRIWPNLINQSNNGSLINNPVFDSANGGSIVLDGVNNYIPISGTINLGNIFTILCWVKLSTLAGGTYIIYGLDANGSDNWLSISANQVSLLATEIADVNTFSINGGSLSSTNIWYHVGATINSNIAKVYLNGIEQNSTTVAFSIGNWNSSNTAIGRRGILSQFYFPGSISSLQTYNKVLLPSEILQNYNAQKSRFNL